MIKRPFILTILITLTQALVAQTNVNIQFPDSLKRINNYYSPYVTVSVSPWVMGVVYPGEPLDSIHSFKSVTYLWGTEITSSISDSSTKKYSSETGFKIFVDTAQEIIQQNYFYKTYKYDSLYASPRYVQMVDKKGKTHKIKCRRNNDIDFAAMPVYIVNTTNNILHVIDKDCTVNLTQEVLDKQGNWVVIETYKTGSCGMTWGWKPVLPGQILITRVLKYKGRFKTLARLKLNNGAIYYSQPYSVSINEDIFSGKIKTTVMDGNLFELHQL
jgi:hypothetical protein